MACILCNGDNVLRVDGGGLKICSLCHGGDLSGVETRLGIKVETRTVQIMGGASRGHSQVVEITLPGRSELMGLVEQMPESPRGVFSRLFKRGGRKGLDRETATFEEAVTLKPEGGAEQQLYTLFENPAVKTAALDLVCMGCTIEFLPQSLWATARSMAHPPVLPPANEVAARLAAIAGAVVER